MAQHFRMVFFNFGLRSAYTTAVEEGARGRAAELGVVLDVVNAQPDSTGQAQLMRDAIASGQYIGGFVLAMAQGLLCDVGTEFAPDNNFMLAVTNTPLCGREANEGVDTWAPGTLTFVSAGQEISHFTAWGEYIRGDNPGKQKVILLTGPETAAQSQNAIAGLGAIERQHPEFDVVETVYTDVTQQDAERKTRAALATHPETTVVASTYSELAAGAVGVFKGQRETRVYDLGGGSSVLPLIASGEIRMTAPSYPKTMGATAIQALYDARIGRTPITRFYANGGRMTPSMQGDRPLLFVTRANLDEFRAAGLSEY